MKQKKPRTWVKTFKRRFAPLVRDGSKRQTVRPKPKRPQDRPIAGCPISLREWKGRPYFSKQRKLRESTIIEVRDIIICHNRMQIEGGAALSKKARDEFARSDGFMHFADMTTWFEAEHSLPFEGILIRWK